MAAVWARLRSDLRNRWRAWALLSLVVGVIAGAALTAAAGARRADSAYPRFVERYQAYDVQLGGIPTDGLVQAARIRKKIIAFPEVAVYSVSEFVSGGAVMPSGVTVSFPDIVVFGDPDGRELFTVNRAKVLAGRLFHRDAADEGVVDFKTADRFKLHVGDSVGIPLGDPRAGPQPVAGIRIVGVIVAPGSLPAVGAADLPGIELSPACVHVHAREIPPSTAARPIRLSRGSADLPSFLGRTENLARTENLSSSIDVPQTLDAHLKGVQKTLGYEDQAHGNLSGLIVLPATAHSGQAMSRQI